MRGWIRVHGPRLCTTKIRKTVRECCRKCKDDAKLLSMVSTVQCIIVIAKVPKVGTAHTLNPSAARTLF